VDKKHLLVALVSLAALLVVFVIGCRLVGVADAQQTPISTTLLGFVVTLGYLIWGKADTDAKVRAAETKADTAATAAAHVRQDLGRKIEENTALTAAGTELAKVAARAVAGQSAVSEVETHGPRPHPPAAEGDEPGD
jgi:hypothetical protein